MLLYKCYWVQWGLLDKKFGRVDTQEPDLEGRVPLWENANVKEMKDKFVAIGFGPHQVFFQLYYFLLLQLYFKF